MGMEADDTYAVSELARMSGVTVRTLHHYDEIGLLVPSGRTSSGYRVYSAADAERLGHVLAYRQCGLTLAEIEATLAETTGDRSVHLRRQLALLDARAAELDAQRTTLRRAVEAMEMGINLDPEEILEVFGEHDPAQYGEEVRERWGGTDAYVESQRRTSSYTRQDWLQQASEREEIEAGFAALLVRAVPAADPQAADLAERHRAHIERWFYPCPYEMQAGLAEMYVADPRFAAHYDARVAGLAIYVRDAILANAIDRIS